MAEALGDDLEVYGERRGQGVGGRAVWSTASTDALRVP